VPHWGRPTGALTGGSGEGWRDEFESRRRRFFSAAEQERGDEYQRVYSDPGGFKSRSFDTLPPEAYVGDELQFTGYDLGSVRGDRVAEDLARESSARRVYEDDMYHDNTTARLSREDALVQSAREKLRKARVKGKTNVSLSVEEMAALERSSTQQRDISEPSTPPSSKNRGSRSSSTTSLASTRPRKTSVGLFGNTSPSQSRSRTPKTARKASNEQQQTATRASGPAPPAFMIRGPDGVPMYAPAEYYPLPTFPMQPSSNGTRQVTPPYEAYSDRSYSMGLGASSSPSTRSGYDEGVWASSSYPAAEASYPDMSRRCPSSSSQTYQIAMPSAEVSYATLRRAPQGSPLYNMEAAADGREWEDGRSVRPQSSESSSDSSGQGVRVEVEAGHGLRRVPVASKSSGTVRRRSKR
jgi:hypothetical protein